MNLQLRVWQEVARRLEIQDSLARLGPSLGRGLLADLIVVRWIDLTHQRLETVAAVAPRPGGTLPATGRTPCTPDELGRLLDWIRQGALLDGVLGEGALTETAEADVASHKTREKGTRLDLVRLIVPPGMGGRVLIGPLADADGPLGAIIMSPTTSRGGMARHRAGLLSLLEAFSVALRNDRRLQELERIREAVEADKRALLDRLQRQDITDSLVGTETGLREVIEKIAQVAPTDAPVLLVGEPGTGREAMARTLHTRSRRAAGPMLRLNCSAIPPDLIDAELCGHEAAGSSGGRRGWFERADGGTLLLDELGELPPSAQARLLQVIEEGTLTRVGGRRTVAVDVRIVAATNADLQAMVAAGRLRADLWQRLSVFPVRLPPLRERTEDIPPLAAHFAWRAGRRLGGAPLVPSPEQVGLLLAYPWPGNVRELAAVIERAAILGEGKRLVIGAALGVMAGPGAIVGGLRADAAGSPRTSSFPTLDTNVAHHIESALQTARGRIEGPQGAAALLGVNPHTLRSRMRRMGIDWAAFRTTAGHQKRGGEG